MPQRPIAFAAADPEGAVRRAVWLVLVVLVLAGCDAALGDRRVLPPTFTRPVPTIVTVPTEAGGRPAITEVVFGQEGTVTITNLGMDRVDLDPWWLCSRNECFRMSGDLPPGWSKEVPHNEIHPLFAAGGDLALFRNEDFDDPADLVDYVAWGRGDDRMGLAVSAGVWPDGDAVPAPGSLAIRAPGGAASAADWAIGTSK